MSNASNGNVERFVTEDSFKNNLASQLNMSPKTVAQLRDYDVTEGTSLKLEYFFYTNNIEKAQSLAEALTAQNYSVQYGASAHDNNMKMVTGWTTPIQISNAEVLAWTEQMCRVGYEHDCEFDGWGTNPGQ